MDRFRGALAPWVLLGLLVAGAAGAQETNPQAAEALQATQKLLTTPDARQAVLEKDERARAADAEARRVAGSPENTEAIYALAAEILEGLSADAAGDPQRMSALVEEAMKNPEAFANRLTPAQKERLRELAQKVPAAQR